MKANLVKIFILTLATISCTDTKRQSVNIEKPITSEGKENFEAVDVYLNPNTFEKHIGRMSPGDTPPALNIEKWFNGEAVESYETGKVYVVEFFASWCKPCQKSIPHLNKLQKEFKDDLVVIGVAASESEPNSIKLEKMLKAKQDMLTYLVAYTSDEKSFKDWNWSARNTGLPWAFIIDKKGKLAWFGQPFQSRFEPVLRSILNDTYFVDNEVLVNNATFENRKSLWEVQEQFWGANQEEDWTRVMKLGRQMYESNDQLFYYEMAQMFYVQYSKLNEKKQAQELAKNLVSGMLDGIPEGQGFIARTMSENAALTETDRDWAVSLAKKANELTLYENPDLLNLLATLHIQSSNKSEARTMLQKAIEINDDEDLAIELTDKLVNL